MKKGNKTFMLVAILVMFALLGFGRAYNSGVNFRGLDLLVFALIVIIGGIALYLSHKKDKLVAEGFPEEDEMSLLLKYKAGYIAFTSSIFMWLIFYAFKDAFPDLDTMMFGGMLTSIVIFFIAKYSIKNRLNE